jgi:hypothetical protein
MVTYLVVLAVVKWETIRTLLSWEQLASSWKKFASHWSDLSRGLKSKNQEAFG